MLLVAIAVFAGATVQSVTGFGFVLVVGPALFAVLEPGQALTILFVVGSLVCALLLVTEGRERSIRTDQMSVLLPAAVPGALVGVLVLRALSKPTLQVAVGIAVLIAAALVWRGASAEAPAGTPSRGGSVVVGLLTGLLTTSTGTSGPPVVLWFQRLALSPAENRDTLAATFLALNPVGAASLLLLGAQPGVPSAEWLLVPVGIALVGYFLGRELFRRLDESIFRRL